MVGKCIKFTDTNKEIKQGIVLDKVLSIIEYPSIIVLPDDSILETKNFINADFYIVRVHHKEGKIEKVLCTDLVEVFY